MGGVTDVERDGGGGIGCGEVGKNVRDHVRRGVGMSGDRALS